MRRGERGSARAREARQVRMVEVGAFLDEVNVNEKAKVDVVVLPVWDMKLWMDLSGIDVSWDVLKQ